MLEVQKMLEQRCYKLLIKRMGEVSGNHNEACLQLLRIMLVLQKLQDWEAVIERIDEYRTMEPEAFAKAFADGIDPYELAKGL